MRNKYMRRGVLLLIAGVALNILGYYTEKQDQDVYKWEMTAGTLLFGLGFLSVLYSLIRKVERAAILEERAEEHNHVPAEASVPTETPEETA